VIDRSHKGDSPNASPESSSNNASPALDAGPAPPVNSINGPSRVDNPSLMLTSPTPQATPGTKVEAPPGVSATPPPVKKGNGDAKLTLDKVEEKLEGLVQEQEDQTSAPHRPGPTPLPPSVLSSQDPSLNDVVAEGARLADLSRVRAGSASFGQVRSHPLCLSSWIGTHCFSLACRLLRILESLHLAGRMKVFVGIRRSTRNRTLSLSSSLLRLSHIRKIWSKASLFTSSLRPYPSAIFRRFR